MLEKDLRDYFSAFTLNEKVLAAAVYKATERLMQKTVWKGEGALRIPNLIQALHLSDDIINNAQISKTVWKNMSKENKTQIFLSLIDLMDIPYLLIKSDAFLNRLAEINRVTKINITKESYINMMREELDFIIMGVESELGTMTLCDIKERSVLFLD